MSLWLVLLLDFLAWTTSAQTAKCNASGVISYCDYCSTCDPHHGCIVKPNYCLIRGFCYKQGHLFTSKSGKSTCSMMCDPAHSNSSWLPAPTGTPCNDGIFCNGIDHCQLTEGRSQCTQHSGDPCLANPFCNKTCAEEARSCHRQSAETCKNTSACDEAFLCQNGMCTSSPIIPRPNCTKCPCNTFTSCNTTSGVCVNVPSTGPSSGPSSSTPETPFWKTPAFMGALGGAAISVLFLACLCVRHRYVMNQNRNRLTTVYHKVDEEDEAMVINKGL